MDVEALPDYDKRLLIRQAMLSEQSEWLEEADKAESFTMVAVAKVIAEAFEKAAAKYKTKNEVNFHDHGQDIGGTGSAWDDEHTATSLLLDESGGSEGRG